MESTYYAHSRERDGKKEYQTIERHAVGVAETVKAFSGGWCEETLAENLGLLHDVGKYQPAFQRRILGSGEAVEHSNCGAKEWTAYRLPDAAPYILAGHHAGLPDAGQKVQTEDRPTLSARLRRPCEDYGDYKKELRVKALPEGADIFKGAVQGRGESAWKEYAFWTRMMFSCLVDADYLDTEGYCEGEKPRGLTADFSECAALLDKKLSELERSAETPVERARQNLRAQVMAHADGKADVYYMNMPTGSGKTLASMRFALARALEGSKKHIIYMIPYTSIIEQNAKVFKDIFGEDKVLEHHCNFDYESAGEGEGTTREKMQRSAENWDASIIVTTNVRFFESIYGNRPGALRRLHNMADSILVFDEVHMLPSGWFQPCLEAIKILTTRYGCEAVFLTATMPDFDRWLDAFKCGGLKTCRLIGDTSCFSAFERCVTENLGAVSAEALLMRAGEAKNALIVVNTRRKARELFAMYAGKKYHLSTYMTHADRDETIRAVKKALASGERFCLFSTSLIEAGVDLDFDTVFREQAGLENLLQTAGRCNRSGRKDRTECKAYSFEWEGERDLKSLKKKKYYTGEALGKFEKPDSAEAVGWYFDKLYADELESMRENDFLYASAADGASDVSPIVGFFDPSRIFGPRITRFHFAGYGEKFRLIEDGTRSLVIVDSRNRGEVQALFDALEYGKAGRNVKRRLQKYAVAVRGYEWQALQEAGVVQTRAEIAYLANENYYDPATGLSLEDGGDYYID